MRAAQVVWLVLLLLPVTGCVHDRPARSSSFLDHFRGTGPSGPDAVFLEYAVIERPEGSVTIDRDVWSNIDELIIPAESRVLLTENGFRVGMVGGLLPSELEGMISNPKSEIGHRQRRLYVNNQAALTINGPIGEAEFDLRTSSEAQPTSLKFEQAKFSINFTPTHASDGRITLRCVPEVEHQQKKNWLPNGGSIGWMNGASVESYDSLAWSVTLSPRDFLVIGAQRDSRAGLGRHAFCGERGKEKVQRLLVIRAGRLAPTETTLEPPPNVDSKEIITPIASQASFGGFHGERP